MNIENSPLRPRSTKCSSDPRPLSFGGSTLPLLVSGISDIAASTNQEAKHTIGSNKLGGKNKSYQYLNPPSATTPSAAAPSAGPLGTLCHSTLINSNIVHKYVLILNYIP